MCERLTSVQTVFVQIKPPSRHDDGQVCEGAFVVNDNVVTLTNREGKPVKDAQGRTYKQSLRQGENPRSVAARLTKELRSALRGRNGPVAGFGRALDYPKQPIV